MTAREDYFLYERRAKLARFIHEKKMNSSKTRDIIADIFFKADRHVSLQSLFDLVRKNFPRIGISTVYRTLKVLQEAGLAVERRFSDSETVYENYDSENHHDHAICLNCSSILEFENQEIEALQMEVAKKLEFVLIEHKLELYGYCKKCHEKIKADS